MAILLSISTLDELREAALQGRCKKGGARIQLHADVHVFRVFGGELCDVCCLKVRHLRPALTSQIMCELDWLVAHNF